MLVGKTASVVLLGMASTPELPKDTPIAASMAAFGPTGYMTFVKVRELLGGPLILGPVFVNILAFHQFVVKDGILQPMPPGNGLLSVCLLWVERGRWKALVSWRPSWHP